MVHEDASSQLPLRFEVDRPARPARTVLRVSQLLAEVRALVEQSLGTVWVEGEISNFRPSSAGHLYFTLKDESAQLSIVLFRRQALLLRFRPEDGLAVRIRGALSVYEQRGQLQLVAETMEPVGVGSLQLAFEQLRERLRAEGLFDSEHKRPLPSFPRTVAVVTSPTGAVIRDFLQIVRRRHAALDVLVVPVAVQGDSAAAEIEAALRRLADPAMPVSVDLVVLARGGGSLEDMAAFNSERVARAIAASSLPVVSAIGHETDFTIADFVADLRAPTPSAAAELVTTSLANVADSIFELRRRLERAARFQLLQARQHYASLRDDRIDQSLTTALRLRQQRLDDLSDALETAMTQRLRHASRQLELRAARVLRRDPQRSLGAAREHLAGLYERLHAAATRGCHSAALQHRALAERLDRAATSVVETRRRTQTQLQLQLAALSPLAVLERGYALVQAADGSILRDAAQLLPGQLVQTRLGKGSFTSRVERTQPAPAISGGATAPLKTKQSTNESTRETMRKLFGTDGIRGVAGQPPLDQPTVYAVGLAVAHSLRPLAIAPRVLVGRDTRESSGWILSIFAAGLRAGGAEMVSAGVLPTPAIAYLTRRDGFHAGVVLSASHNPWQDNGIKLFGGDGFKLPDEVELAIEEILFRHASHSTAPALDTLAPIDDAPHFAAEYIRFLLSLVPGLRLDGRRIVVDCANGAAAAVAPALFRALGGDVALIHTAPNGRNINDHCGALYPQTVAAVVVEHGAQLGITLDGDADRCLLAGATNNVINGDAILLLCAREMQARGLLTGSVVVATTMSNMGLEAALRRSGIRMLRAAVGDRYVLELMRRHDAALGGEQSGHILFPHLATTGDGLLTALVVLDVLTRSGRSLEELTADLQVFPQVIVNVKVREKLPLESFPSIVAAIAAAEAALQDSGRVVIRYSGTEALARVMIEAADEAAMRHHADAIASAIRSELGI